MALTRARRHYIVTWRPASAPAYGYGYYDSDSESPTGATSILEYSYLPVEGRVSPGIYRCVTHQASRPTGALHGASALVPRKPSANPARLPKRACESEWGLRLRPSWVRGPHSDSSTLPNLNTKAKTKTQVSTPRAVVLALALACWDFEFPPAIRCAMCDVRFGWSIDNPGCSDVIGWTCGFDTVATGMG